MIASPLLIFVLLLLLYLVSSVYVLKEYERGVVFRLGKLLPQPKGPGVVLVFRPIDSIVRVGLRTAVHDVPPQDIITRDNVSVKVNAVVYYRVVDPLRAIVEVENYTYATSQLAQTTLRSVLGQAELDDLLASRDRLNQDLQRILDSQTDPWGIKVSAVEVKHVDLPEDMRRAMARQAEAEREKRAKIIHAEGELIASEKLTQAAAIIGTESGAMTLRYLQTLNEIAAEQNSTIVFPLPIELLSPAVGPQTVGGWTLTPRGQGVLSGSTSSDETPLRPVHRPPTASASRPAASRPSSASPPASRWWSPSSSPTPARCADSRPRSTPCRDGRRWRSPAPAASTRRCSLAGLAARVRADVAGHRGRDGTGRARPRRTRPGRAAARR